MAIAWASGVWGTNSWVGMNAGPPNAWRGASTVVTTVTPQTGGGYYKRQIPLRKHWLEEYRELKGVIDKPIATEAKRLFKVRLPAFELPSVEDFIEDQERITERKLKQEYEELMELLQIL